MACGTLQTASQGLGHFISPQGCQRARPADTACHAWVAQDSKWFQSGFQAASLSLGLGIWLCLPDSAALWRGTGSGSRKSRDSRPRSQTRLVQEPARGHVLCLLNTGTGRQHCPNQHLPAPPSVSPRPPGPHLLPSSFVLPHSPLLPLCLSLFHAVRWLFHRVWRL